jgi:hypothetical protein
VRCPSPLPRDPPAVPLSSLASHAAGGTILGSGDDTLRGSCRVPVDKGRSTGDGSTGPASQTSLCWTENDATPGLFAIWPSPQVETSVPRWSPSCSGQSPW